MPNSGTAGSISNFLSELAVFLYQHDTSCNHQKGRSITLIKENFIVSLLEKMNKTVHPRLVKRNVATVTLRIYVAVKCKVGNENMHLICMFKVSIHKY